MPPVRAFLACSFPDPALVQVVRCVDHLQGHCERSGLRISWVPQRNMHLTLKFLGDVPDTALADLAAHLGQALRSVPAPRVGLRSLGAFPTAARPRALYVGVDDLTGLVVVHDQLEAAAAELGYPPEDRPFQPHLTIGRVRVGRADLSELLRPYAARRFGDPAPLDEVRLYTSHLGDGPPVYTLVAQLPLGAA